MYAKEGPARYLSHLDLIRTFDRAVRRAGLPVVFSQGFNPHLKLSFAAPLAVGTIGEAEFADMELTEDLPAGIVAKSLSAVLPEGLRLIEIRLVPDSLPALMAVVDRAVYSASAQLDVSLEKETLEKTAADFLAMPEILAERRSKTGEKRMFDIKPGIFAMSATINNDIIMLSAELKTGSSGNIRFEELIAAFVKSSGLRVRGNFELRREALYPNGNKDQEMLW
jgi:radical SAM-linked protein